MFLRNFDIWRTGIFHNDGSVDTEYTEDSSLILKKAGGAKMLLSLATWVPFKDLGGSLVGTGKTVLIAGLGDTPVSYDDYKLANYTNLVSSSTPSRSNFTYNSINDTYESTISAVLTNISDYEVIIKEIGLAVGLGNVGYIGCVLLFREVLDAPITLQPNSGTAVSFNYSTDGHSNKPDTYYKVTNALTNCTATWNIGSTCSGEYRDTFTASEGYTLPASITVTMDGVAVPSMRYSYNSSTGAFSMTGITDDVVITVTA